MEPNKEKIEELFEVCRAKNLIPNEQGNYKVIEDSRNVILKYVDSGYDVNVECPHQNYRGRNPLEYFMASFYDDYPFEYNVSFYKNEPEKIFEHINWFIDIMFTNGIDPMHDYCNDGRTALFFAILNMYFVKDKNEIFKKMIRYGYDLDTLIPEFGFSIAVWAHYRNYIDFDSLKELVALNDERKQIN